MCGIAGYTGDDIQGLLDHMIKDIRFRGPDASGRYEQDSVHLGHTRLSILDIEGGQQPMISNDGNIVVVYNGEIYNYDALRDELEALGHTFRTTCDTELLPIGYSQFGVNFFSRLNGMFAFSLLDKGTGELHLVRDPFGIKPLYYAIVNNELIFSSSARAITKHPQFESKLRPEAIRDFLQFRYVPSGMHFFKGIKTLSQGTIATWHNSTLTTKTYWHPHARLRSEPPITDAAKKDWTQRVGTIFSDSIKMQLRSDVPVGIFLSGGVDSTAVTHFAAEHSAHPLTAFTFSMAGSVDETSEASEIAKTYDIKHHVIGGQEPLDLARLYDAVTCMDLPVGDAIILPTYLLCEAAARTHKVVLTGEGADEIFGGYVHYPVLRKLDKLSRTIPWLRYLSPMVHWLPIPLLNRYFDYQASLGVLGRRKIAKLMSNLGHNETLFRLASSVIDDDEIALATTLPSATLNEDTDLSWDGLITNGLKSWLPNQILNKMDQLSMAHGLEARVPFLDPRLYETVAEAPLALLMNRGENKVLLRNLLRTLKVANSSAPKRAFHVPMEEMYRDQLTDLCHEWLSEERINRHGILKFRYVQDSLKHLAAGEFVASKRLVTMISLHMWLDANGGSL